jgi:hypothetical protein
MSDVSRRLFLANSAGLAAAGAAVAALPSMASVLPGTAATAADEAPASLEEITAAGPLVVHVADAASGEISVMTGESEVVIRDRTIVSRIVAAANGHLPK